jgi:hypothetical protein
MLKSLLLIASGVILVPSAAAQEKIRKIEDVPLYRNSPIIVVGRMLGDKAFGHDNNVLGNQDWLKHLILAVKNVSNKNIVYFNIDLLVWKQGKMPGAIVFPVEFPLVAGRDAAATDKSTPKVLKPGEIVEVSVKDFDYAQWINELKKYEVSEVDKVTLDIRLVHFDDGTGWQMGLELRQDPSNNKRWIPIDIRKPAGASKHALRLNKKNEPNNGSLFLSRICSELTLSSRLAES